MTVDFSKFEFSVVRINIGREGWSYKDTKTVEFEGCLLSEGRINDEPGRGVDYEIYLTKKGNILLYFVQWSDWQNELTKYDYLIYESLDELIKNKEDEISYVEMMIPYELLNEAYEKLYGKPMIEKLDV